MNYSLIKIFVSAYLIFPVILTAQTQYNGSLTSYDAMIQFIDSVDNQSELIDSYYFAETKERRKIPYVSISQNTFGNDASKIKVIIFAAQHGNEQSSKEGTLILLSEIAKSRLNYLFDKIDLIVIPNMNPDGTEKDQRRNSNNVDLNRNHLILTENETAGLHKLFNAYCPEASLDVHEYYPYSKSWIEYGLIKNFDEQYGTLTNPNITNKLRAFQKEKFIPFIESYLIERGFTFNEYVLDGPPNTDRMRYSTVDINDGRQSFGILNTFSFIVEGKNAKQSLDNITHRSLAQFNAMKGFLDFIYLNKDEIKKLVTDSRSLLTNSSPGESVAVRMEHVKGGSPVELNLFSLETQRDTQVTIEEFHSLVEPHLSVLKPVGYLIPKQDKNLTELLSKHNWEYEEYHQCKKHNIIRYKIDSVGKGFEEGVESAYPSITKEPVNDAVLDEYYFVPTNQLASNLIVIALEPESMLGLIQYKEFGYLVEKEYYSIFRVE